jgi:hypothetical protein
MTAILCQPAGARAAEKWIPASAGMTIIFRSAFAGMTIIFDAPSRG